MSTHEPNAYRKGEVRAEAQSGERTDAGIHLGAEKYMKDDNPQEDPAYDPATGRLTGAGVPSSQREMGDRLREAGNRGEREGGQGFAPPDEYIKAAVVPAPAPSADHLIRTYPGIYPDLEQREKERVFSEREAEMEKEREQILKEHEKQRGHHHHHHHDGRSPDMVDKGVEVGGDREAIQRAREDVLKGSRAGSGRTNRDEMDRRPEEGGSRREMREERRERSSPDRSDSGSVRREIREERRERSSPDRSDSGSVRREVRQERRERSPERSDSGSVRREVKEERRERSSPDRSDSGSLRREVREERRERSSPDRFASGSVRREVREERRDRSPEPREVQGEGHPRQRFEPTDLDTLKNLSFTKSDRWDRDSDSQRREGGERREVREEASRDRDGTERRDVKEERFSDDSGRRREVRDETRNVAANLEGDGRHREVREEVRRDRDDGSQKRETRVEHVSEDGGRRREKREEVSRDEDGGSRKREVEERVSDDRDGEHRERHVEKKETDAPRKGYRMSDAYSGGLGEHHEAKEQSHVSEEGGKETEVEHKETKEGGKRRVEHQEVTRDRDSGSERSENKEVRRKETSVEDGGDRRKTKEEVISRAPKGQSSATEDDENREVDIGGKSVGEMHERTDKEMPKYDAEEERAMAQKANEEALGEVTKKTEIKDDQGNKIEQKVTADDDGMFMEEKEEHKEGLVHKLKHALHLDRKERKEEKERKTEEKTELGLREELRESQKVEDEKAVNAIVEKEEKIETPKGKGKTTRKEEMVETPEGETRKSKVTESDSGNKQRQTTKEKVSYDGGEVEKETKSKASDRRDQAYEGGAVSNPRQNDTLPLEILNPEGIKRREAEDEILKSGKDYTKVDFREPAEERIPRDRIERMVEVDHKRKQEGLPLDPETLANNFKVGFHTADSFDKLDKAAQPKKRDAHPESDRR